MIAEWPEGVREADQLLEDLGGSPVSAGIRAQPAVLQGVADPNRHRGTGGHHPQGGDHLLGICTDRVPAEVLP